MARVRYLNYRLEELPNTIIKIAYFIMFLPDATRRRSLQGQFLKVFNRLKTYHRPVPILATGKGTFYSESAGEM